MNPASWIAALCTSRPTRRQIARALGSGGFEVRFIEGADKFAHGLEPRPPDLAMIDADSVETAVVEKLLQKLESISQRVPVVLLSLGADKRGLLELLRRHEIGNLIAKHGAIRAAFPVLDERELLVTCMKVVQRNIFGLDKYIGGWAIDLTSRMVKSMEDKRSVLDEFEAFLANLDAPKAIVPNVVIAADELILNAMVHAPRDASGRPKYEAAGPVSTMTLEPGEYVRVDWGCDGQRLMFAVTDNFGTLNKRTVYEYVARAFSEGQLIPENKPGGAGLGLSMAFMSIHQLVFNVWDSKRTEAIAGWYLRVNNAVEFRGVAKSLNLFWVPADTPPPAAAVSSQTARPAAPKPPQPSDAIARLVGRIDEGTDLSVLSTAAVVDLRELTAVTSRGVVQWLTYLRARKSPLRIIGLPDAMVRLSGEVRGLLINCEVASVAMPWECEACDEEQRVVVPLGKISLATPSRCNFCGGPLTFVGVPEAYARLIGRPT